MSVILQCRRCNQYSSSDQVHCTACGTSLVDAARVVDSERLAVGPDAALPTVKNRYQDAYRGGSALVAVGETIKVIGGVLAALTVLVAILSGERAVLLAGIFAAALIGGILWVNGVIVAAQGQILRATLDGAVHTSPFLTNAQRAAIMGLDPTPSPDVAAPASPPPMRESTDY